ncbi:MAG: FG-GAP repeat protein [Ignavibacteria bacterium]|nr:FG-GAP repeat protein [Ignavibacteria bacterium]
MIIGTPYLGRAFVYHGSAAGLSDSVNWTVESHQAGAWFGNSVSPAGDVNGDGYSDVIVGALSYDNGESDEGRVFVYHGSAAGLSDSTNWTAESNQSGSSFGYSVSTAGDVNGDGYSDVIVGALLYDNGETDEGRVFVYHGSAAGLSYSANWTAESDQENSGFGHSVSSAGDVNGDGYSDVIVGAWTFNFGKYVGRTFVYHGSVLILNLKVYIQGIYNSSSNLIIQDTLKVFLRNYIFLIP